MAPEQAQGKIELLNERSDVYALGAVLYFLLTGQSPRQAGSTHARPRQINASIPRPIEAVCLQAMAQHREDRYPSAQKIADDITRFLDGQPVLAYPENIFEKSGRWLGKNRFILFLILAYLLMRVIVFLFAGR